MIFDAKQLFADRSFRKLRWSAIAVPLKSRRSVRPGRGRPQARELPYNGPAAIHRDRRTGELFGKRVRARAIGLDVLMTRPKSPWPSPNYRRHRRDRELRERFEVIAKNPTGVHQDFDILRGGIDAGSRLTLRFDNPDSFGHSGGALLGRARSAPFRVTRLTISDRDSSYKGKSSECGSLARVKAIASSTTAWMPSRCNRFVTARAVRPSITARTESTP